MLKAIAKLDVWRDELRPLLLAACEDLPDYTREETKGIALLARHKAGLMSLGELVQNFPREFSGAYRDAKTDRQFIAKSLSSIREHADALGKRRIAGILRTLGVRDA